MSRQHISVVRDDANYICFSVYPVTTENDKVLHLFVEGLKSKESIHSPNILTVASLFSQLNVKYLSRQN